ncbi:MAG TPA: PhzF family phenazine biosynthesis isomerase [Jatrophihabitantaceae bacterium]|nr:PhzF family phenazine biosynthesis isomerase [Jatrophihabitantaceae bacterium]
MNARLEARILRYAAFTDGGTGGNPAGVVLDADDLDDATRLSIAAHVGYSETAFVDACDPHGEYRVRYFSPRAEVDFCGHATIAAGVALAERGAAGELVFNIRPGRVVVATARTAEGGSTATLTSVPPRTRPAGSDELRAALAAFGLTADDLDPRYPSSVAYAGNDHLILALASRERLAALDYDFDALGALMAERSWTTVHLVFAHEPTVFSARDPFPPGGVVEDPATGAAAAAFGGYLRALGLVDVPGEVTILQGADMGRPSRLTVGIPAEGGIRVTGAATLIG